MTYRVLFWLAAVCAGASVVGCKSDDAEEIPLDSLAARYAETYCARIQPCCQEQTLAYDAATCRSNATSLLQLNINKLKQRQVGYDAQAAGECLAAFADSAGCGEDDVEDVPACERVFHGLLAPGATCESSQECAEPSGKSATCEPAVADGESDTGICMLRTVVVLKHGAQGADCRTTCSGSSCTQTVDEGTANDPAPQPFPGDGVACYRSDNLYCSSNSTCQPLVALGEPCEGYGACAGDAFCDIDGILPAATATCLAPRPAGGACNSSDQCQSGRCDYDANLCLDGSVSQDDCSGVIDD